VERYGQLSVSGAHIVDESAAPVALHGLGFGWDNWWPQFYNASVVSWVAEDFCVDVVRPAMGIEPDGAYLQDPSASQARIEAVADAAIAAGLYVIIDWHAHELHQAEATAFFAAMAQKYGTTPNVLYEIYNEPTNAQTWPEVKAYAESVIGAIRAIDPDNIIIVGSPEWDQRIDLVQADPISDQTNIAYSVHYYAGTHGAWLRDRTQTAINAGIPVIVTESSGSAADGLGANNYVEWEAWFSFLETNQIGWINYAIADKVDETISILEPGASGSGGWDESSLTESGEYIRTKLRGYCE
jgi:endoglucanase